MKYFPSIESFAKVQDRWLYQQISDWVVQEKVDGMNMSVVYANNDREFRGRTDRATYDYSLIPMPSFELVQETMSITNEDTRITLFGEACGGGIQKRWYFNTPTFVLFDIMYERGDMKFYMDAEAVCSIGEKLGCIVVPTLGTASKIINTEEALASYGTVSALNSDMPLEGVVVKPFEELVDKRKNRVIYKTCGRYFGKEGVNGE